MYIKLGFNHEINHRIWTVYIVNKSGSLGSAEVLRFQPEPEEKSEIELQEKITYTLLHIPVDNTWRTLITHYRSPENDLDIWEEWIENREEFDNVKGYYKFHDTDNNMANSKDCWISVPIKKYYWAGSRGWQPDN